MRLRLRVKICRGDLVRELERDPVFSLDLHHAALKTWIAFGRRTAPP